MQNSIKELEEQIQGLPLSDLVTLHEHLITEIQEREEHETLDPAYKAELERRIQEIKSGSVLGMDAFTALEDM